MFERAQEHDLKNNFYTQLGFILEHRNDEIKFPDIRKVIKRIQDHNYANSSYDSPEKRLAIESLNKEIKNYHYLQFDLHKIGLISALFYYGSTEVTLEHSQRTVTSCYMDEYNRGLKKKILSDHKKQQQQGVYASPFDSLEKLTIFKPIPSAPPPNDASLEEIDLTIIKQKDIGGYNPAYIKERELLGLIESDEEGGYNPAYVATLKRYT